MRSAAACAVHRAAVTAAEVPGEVGGLRAVQQHLELQDARIAAIVELHAETGPR